jgi:hypothetical protein
MATTTTKSEDSQSSGKAETILVTGGATSMIEREVYQSFKTCLCPA